MASMIPTLKYLIENTASSLVELSPRKDNRKIIVFGAPRSGTTWLFDIIGQLPNSKLIFEPLNPNWFPDIQKLNLLPRPYINPTSSFPELENYIERIISGISRSYNPPYSIIDLKRIIRRFYFDTVITKFVRGNRLIPWLTENFKQTFKGILIVRHPCATILSQLKTGWIGYPKEIEAMIMKEPTKAIYPFRKIILKELEQISEINKRIIKKVHYMNSIEQLLAVEYAIDYLIPLRCINNTKQDSILVITYEELITNFEKSIKIIFNHINENIPPNIQTVYTKPSKTTKKSEKKYIGSKRQLEKWKSKLTHDQVHSILEVLELFDFNVYTEEPEPNYRKLKEV